jgi:MtN3 and saliva related transmembrane protein
MQFDIIDHNVSITTNVFLVIANIINLFYNIPQMYKTYKCKSTKDFSPTFLLLRIIGNTIWIEYAIEVNSFLMLLNNIVTVFSSLFIGYYKLNELLQQRKNINVLKQQELELNTFTINNDDENQNGDSSNDGSNDDKNKLIDK